MRGGTEIEAFAAMPSGVGDRKGADGNRERLLRGVARARLALTRKDARHVRFDRQIDDAPVAVGPELNANGTTGAGGLERGVRRLLCREGGHEDHEENVQDKKPS